MKKYRFSESQIVGILKEVEMGAKVGEMYRKHGIGKPTYYKWKSQFSGIKVSHLAQLRQLQDENAEPRTDVTQSRNRRQTKQRPGGNKLDLALRSPAVALHAQPNMGKQISLEGSLPTLCG